MIKTLAALTLIVARVPSAVAQDSNVLPPATLRENAQIVPTQTTTEQVMKEVPGQVPFCPRKTCLYYAGDFDSANSDANGLYNANDVGGKLEGQAWVGVKPDRDATVTGATFVEILVATGGGLSPIPFAVQVGIKPGQAGKTICSSNGDATYTLLGFVYDLPLYSVTVKKLSASCKLKKGRVYYVNLLPTFSNSYGYAANVEDAKPKNHRGWKNDLNDCFFNGTAFGANYVTCNSQGFGTNGFSELSIALTGMETK
jgi:hypothetical protein